MAASLLALSGVVGSEAFSDAIAITTIACDTRSLSLPSTPMKAAQFYKHWNGLVTEDWRAHGLSKLPAKGSKWTRPVGNLLLLFWVQVNIKYPWSVESGGDFSVYAFLPREVPAQPARYQDNVMDELLIFNQLDDRLRGELDDLNHRLVQKFRDLDRDSLYRQMAKAYDCTPEQVRDLGFLDTALETLEMQLDSPTHVQVNPPLFYYDADDIVAWTEWFARALPVMLAGIDSAPEYAFRAG